MNLLDKVIEDFLAETIGKDVVVLYQLLKGKEPVSEFTLSEKLNLTVNQVRNMLYRLYSYSIVDFTRKKDKKKGWYIYYWGFDIKKALSTAIEHKEKRLDLLRNLLKNEETGQYFSCPDGDVRFTFEDAIDHDFKCPECDKVLVQDNNSRKIQRLQKTISEFEAELKESKEIKVEVKEKTEKKIKGKSKAVEKPAKKKTVKKTTKKSKVKKKKPAKKKPKKKLLKKVSSKRKKSISKKSHSKKKSVKKKIGKKKSISKRKTVRKRK